MGSRYSRGRRPAFKIGRRPSIQVVQKDILAQGGIAVNGGCAIPAQNLTPKAAEAFGDQRPNHGGNGGTMRAAPMK